MRIMLIMSRNLILFWIYLLQVCGKLLPHSLTNEDPVEHSIGLMTKDIIRRYFSQSHCVGIVSQRGHLFRHILDEVPIVLIMASDIPEMNESEEYGNLREETAAFDRIMVQLLDQSCLDFIVQVSKPKCMVEYFHRSTRRSEVRSHRRYLYLPIPEDLHSQNTDITTIFSMKELDWMPDLLYAKVAIKEYSCSAINHIDYYNMSKETSPPCENSTVVHILTHKFVGNQPYSEVVLDNWTYTKGFFFGENLYKNKLRNFEGKTLTLMGVPNYPPYTVMNDTITPPLYDGIELRFLKEFATFLNFTFRVIYDEENWWGGVFPNGSGNGLWGVVGMDGAMLGFGATYPWLENYPRLAFSFPYYKSSVRCLCPRPKQLPVWMTPILPFPLFIWGCVGLSLLVTAVSLYINTRAILCLNESVREKRQRFATMTDCLIWSAAMVLLVAPDEETGAEYASLRHLLAWLLVYFLLVNSVYSGGLSSVLTVPRFEKPIDTVADLAWSNITWAAPLDAWVFSLLEATEPDLVQLTHTFKVMTEEELLERARAGDTAFSLERIWGGSYALPPYANEETIHNLRAMREDMYYGYNVFDLRKGSPLMELLNTFILWHHSGGLLVNYEFQVMRKFEGSRLQLALAQNDQLSSDDDDPVILEIAHIEGALFFLAIGLVLATIVFISELIKSYYESTQVYDIDIKNKI